MQPYLPSFRHALVDLAPLEDHLLSDHLRLRTFLKAMKYARRKDLRDRYYVVLAEARQLDERDYLATAIYLKMSAPMTDSKPIRETINLFPDKPDQEFLRWWNEPYLEEYTAKGKAEGEAKAKSELLTRLLEQRFGEIPPSIRQRILTADVTSIETWFDRVLPAPDLESVFTST